MASSLVAILAEAGIAPLWQLRPISVLNPTSKAEGPLLITILRSDLVAIVDHSVRLLHTILNLGRRLVGRESVVDVGEVDDEHFGLVFASEECGAFVKTFGHELSNVGDVRHARQSSGLSVQVRLVDFCAIGEVVGGVGGVIVRDQDVYDSSFVLDKRPDGDILSCQPAVGHGDELPILDRRALRKLVEGVGVDAKQVLKGWRLGLVDEGLEDLR